MSRDGVSIPPWTLPVNEDSDPVSSEDNKHLRREDVSPFAENEDSYASKLLSGTDGSCTEDENSSTDEESSNADADDEAFSNEGVTSHSEDHDSCESQDFPNNQDFGNEDVSSCSQNEYKFSSKASVSTEPDEYDSSEDARTAFASENSRLGAAYRCRRSSDIGNEPRRVGWR